MAKTIYIFLSCMSFYVYLCQIKNAVMVLVRCYVCISLCIFSGVCVLACVGPECTDCLPFDLKSYRVTSVTP